MVSGIIRARLYATQGTECIVPGHFLAKPIKGRLSSPLRHKLTYYAGMGPRLREAHPTRSVLGTVSHFQCSTAGSPEFEFTFEYFHSMCRLRQTLPFLMFSLDVIRPRKVKPKRKRPQNLTMGDDVSNERYMAAKRKRESLLATCFQQYGTHARTKCFLILGRDRRSTKRFHSFQP
jgi:hypothetical protein